MKPLLAHVYEPHRVTYPCYVQPKLNGIRALCQGGRFQSRDELPFPEVLLRHLGEPLRQVFDKSVILDGELYVHGWPLQRINAAVTPVRLAPTEDTLKVEYHVFDSVNFERPFINRKDHIMLQMPLTLATQTCMVETHHVTSAQQADEYYAFFVSRGYEGMMYRLGDCPYTIPKQQWVTGWWYNSHRPRNGRLSDQDNRCWHLLKRKDWQDDEFECVGVVEGEGKLNGILGSLSCKKSRDPQSDILFSVGSGLTDSERQHYWQNPPIGRLVKVKYLCLSSDGIPLNPTILAIL